MENIRKIKYINNLLKTKQISCVELTNKYLNAINKYNKELNAYITVTNDLAIKSSEVIDKQIAKGNEIPLLAGIPMTIKDNISTKGILTTCASKMLSNYMPIYDATVYKLLIDNGCILLGKTNMDEFAMGSTCETSYFGVSSNPHNIDYVPGGSSGGGASAVSGNLAVFALGSDTGGSIRQPASFCGIVGFKPSYGTVSRYGLIALASSFDQIGPMTTSVEDASIVYDTISKYDPNDSTSIGHQGLPSINTLRDAIMCKNIGIIEEFFEYANDEVKKSMEKVIDVYKCLGGKIVHLSIKSIKYALPIYYILSCAEASSNLGRYDGVRYGYRTSQYKDIDEMICKTRDEGFGKEVKHRILLGTYVLSSSCYDTYYKKAQSIRASIIQDFDNVFKNCDVILAPTSPYTAFKKNYTFNDTMETYANDICTVPVNIAGLPSISIPCGFGSNNMPIGFQVIGNKFCDSQVLNVAYAYEFATKGTSFRSVDKGVKL